MFAYDLRHYHVMAAILLSFFGALGSALRTFKKRIQSWLEERSGLTRDFVYPTPWHQPHMDGFAVSHGRKARF